MPSLLSCLLLLSFITYSHSMCVVVNGTVERPTEECDDGNTIPKDGCTNCVVDPGYVCAMNELGRSICFVLCGDGLKFPSEMCDDGNTLPDDGCTNCVVDSAYVCLDRNVGGLYPKSKCYEKCPKCAVGEYLITPCTTGIYPIRCVPCRTCGDRQVEIGACTNDQDRVCGCLPGTTPSADGTQCLRVQEIPPTCDWQAWGPWGSCGLCGGVKTRSRNAGPGASPACPSTYLESEVCSTECTGLSYEKEKEIEKKYKEGTSGYGALSLYAFWSGEGASLILGKYGLGVQLSQDPEGDALAGRFLLSFRTPSDNSTDSSNTTACNPSLPSVQQAYAEVYEITYKFLIDRRSIPASAISSKLNSCDIAVEIDTSTDTWLVGAIVGPIVGVGLVLLLAFVWWSKNKPLDLSPLPEPVRWQYEQYQSNPKQWRQLGTGSASFYHKKLDFGSEEFEKLCQIFFDYQGAKEDIPISEAYAVYNPLLISNFINQLQIMRARFQKHPDLFKTSQWMLSDESDAKMKVNDVYTSRSKNLPWNKDEEVAILPAVHGTDFTVAKSICSTGFASLSLLDGGWYGRGIYFSTYAMYTTPYFENRREPALLISYIISGHSFPVTEDHNSQDSLLGKALTSGYSSHYVVVKENGRLPSLDELTNKKIELYDEIVIPQESQIMPLYVLRLDPEKATAVAGLKRDLSSRKGKGKMGKKDRMNSVM